MDSMTQQISYWSPLERGYERMRRMLFEPFDLVKWLVLGFAAWLASLGSGPGGGGNVSGDPTEIGSSVGDAASSAFSSILALSIASFVIVAVLLLVAVVLWISSRGKFIYLDNVVHDRAEIVKPWRDFRKLGDSLFLWRLIFVAIVIAVIGAAVVIPALPAAIVTGGDLDDLSYFAITSWGVLVGIVAVFVAIASIFVALFLDAFIVPIMYRFNLGAVEGWRYFIPWLKARPGSFLLYGLFVLLLAIAYVIISLLVCVLTCCIGALPYVGTVLLLPLLVTYRCFSLEWLAQLDPGFDVFTPLPGQEVVEDQSQNEINEELDGEKS